MPSFDIVSEVDQHELTNAVDQANREVETRFDFKGANASFELSKEKITMKSKTDFQLKQMMDILRSKLAKRNIDARTLKENKPEISLHEAKQTIDVLQGIEKEKAKEIIKTIKESKLKVQAAIQGDQIRITGKKRDDLQEAISLLKTSKIDIPLQFENFRD